MKRNPWCILILTLAAVVLALAFTACQHKSETESQAQQSEAQTPMAEQTEQPEVFQEAAEELKEPVAQEEPEVSAVPETPSPTATTSPYPDAIDFSFTDGEGKKYQLSAFYGKPTIINFFATWCPPCRAELPFFDAAYQNYGDRINFIVLDLVDSGDETVENGLDFLSSNGYSFPLYFDSDFEGYGAYGTAYVPVTVLISADGGLVDSHTGGLSQSELQEMIDRLLNS